jgi:hypothetical protein
MANDEALARIRQEVSVWNDWRAQNFDRRVDLREAYLSGRPSGGRTSTGRPREPRRGALRAARARARGYRNTTAFLTMIYLIPAPLGDLSCNPLETSKTPTRVQIPTGRIVAPAPSRSTKPARVGILRHSQ